MILLLGPSLVLAQNLADCLPDCWASNDSRYGNANGDGTSSDPILVADGNALLDLQDDFGQAMAADNTYTTGRFFEVYCNQAGSCITTRYDYNSAGQQVNREQVANPPVVGVPIPAIYIMIGLVILSLLFIGLGLFTYGKIQRTRAS